MDNVNDETTNEFFNDFGGNYGTEMSDCNLKINSDVCYYYDEYIEIDGVIVNKAEWEKTRKIKVEAELESKMAEMKAETNEIAQHGAACSEIEPRNKRQSERIKNTTKRFKCDSGTLTQVQLGKHTEKSHKDQRGKWFECDQCDHKTKWKKALKIHNISFHISEDQIKWFECDQCDFKTKRTSVLKTHNISVHIPEDQIKLFDCDQCDYKAKRKRYLKKHNISVHIPEDQIKWFKCDQCDYKAKQKGHLKNHISTHISEDQIQWNECKQCDHKTKCKSALKKHYISVHIPEDQIKWFECDQCDYKTKRKSYLKIHNIYKHNPDQMLRV